MRVPRTTEVTISTVMSTTTPKTIVITTTIATTATTQTTTLAAVATVLPITDSQARHVVGRRWSEAHEKTRPATTPAAAITLTASEQSQATQSVFLPGLPSQLLVTQQQQADGGWDRVADEDYQQQEEWEDTAASEYALSLPAPHNESIDDAPTGSSVAAELPSDPRGGFKYVHDAISQCEARSTERVPGGGRGGSRVGEDPERHSRARRNDGFTRILRKLAGSAREQNGVATGPSVESDERNDGRGVCTKQRLVLVPTQEVLPQRWSSGQAGIVGVLEDHLLRARERFSDSYTVRALELACQVFRHPSVCVRTGGETIGGARRDVCMPFGDHAKVVGVAGLVWEILRNESAKQRFAELS